MPYEIDFLPVGEGCSGDAIAIRYAADNGFEVMVVDGGTQDSGEALVKHIQSVYGTNTVDHVVSTHPDNDHASGLRMLFEHLTIRKLWLHMPWYHAEKTRHMFKGTWTTEGLQNSIRRSYPIIAELGDLAAQNNTAIGAAFQGANIGPFIITAPSIPRYERLIPQFRDTPAPNENLLIAMGEWITGLGKKAAKIIRKTIWETRELETLREGGTTSAENESSVVLYGHFPNDDRSVLLTADAGLLALDEAFDYLHKTGTDLTRLGMIQVPHHGSRNNISPSALNRLIGYPLPEGQTRPIAAIVSASLTDEDHPRQVVVNAFERRGVKVYPTHGKPIRHHSKMGARTDWNPATPLPFSTRVEEYD
jgi:beta-lactamase superfamily II metal-dependent hydrolase